MIDQVMKAVEILRYCEETVARCGECPSGKNERGIPNCQRQGNIADLIESLAAELEQVKQERDGLNILLVQAQSMLETRTRERDAAVEALSEIACCADCVYYATKIEDEPCKECLACPSSSKPNWKWREVQEGESND